jgi:hypothetical protein
MYCKARANVCSLIFYLSNSLSLLHKTVPFLKLKNFCSVVHLFVCPIVHLFICLFVCLFICSNAHLFICYFACLFVCMLISFSSSLPNFTCLRALPSYLLSLFLSLFLSLLFFLSLSFFFLSWRPQLQQQWSVRFKHR